MYGVVVVVPVCIWKKLNIQKQNISYTPQQTTVLNVFAQIYLGQYMCVIMLSLLSSIQEEKQYESEKRIFAHVLHGKKEKNHTNPHVFYLRGGRVKFAGVGLWVKYIFKTQNYLSQSKTHKHI